MLVKHYIFKTSIFKEQEIADKVSQLSNVESTYLTEKDSGIGSDIILKLSEDVTNEEILAIGAYLGHLEASEIVKFHFQ